MTRLRALSRRADRDPVCEFVTIAVFFLFCLYGLPAIWRGAVELML